MKKTQIIMRISEREKEEIKDRAEELEMHMSEYILYCVRKELLQQEKLND